MKTNQPTQPPPAYMKSNVNNHFGTAPDKGSMNGPVLGLGNATTMSELHGVVVQADNSDDYWLSSYGSAGQVGVFTLI